MRDRIAYNIDSYLIENCNTLINISTWKNFLPVKVIYFPWYQKKLLLCNSVNLPFEI